MKSCFGWIVLGVLACWAGAAIAQAPGARATSVADPAYDRQAPADGASQVAGQRVFLFREPSGKLVLVVEYPWQVHAKPSVEVRLLGKGEPDDLRIQPMYFRWKYMKTEKMTVAVYKVQDTCEDVPVRAPVREDEATFEVLGDRNSQGVPAVCVARTVWRQEASRRGGPPIQPGAAAAFPLLEPWAMNKRLLYFNLPEKYFNEPGAMRVWFLRDDRILWSDSVAWPGTGAPEAKRAGPVAKPAKKKPAASRPKPRPVPQVKPRP